MKRVLDLDPNHRLYKKRLADYVATEPDLADLPTLIEYINQLDGPAVEWDDDRECYGLKTMRHYKSGELVTTYGGSKSVKEVCGDYVAKGGADCYIDGRVDFKLSEKGRWINESDRDRTVVNVKLGRNVRATRDITQGEWLFADYGPDYERNY